MTINKIKKSVSLLLSLVMLLFVFTLTGSYAEDETAQKNLIQMIDDPGPRAWDFLDNHVIVVLSNIQSQKLLDYTPEDFPEVDCIKVSDLTSCTVAILKGEIDKEYMDLRRMPSIEEFHQILCLTLGNVGKDKVMDAMFSLYEREDIVSANPDYVIYSEDTSANDTYYSLQSGIPQIVLPKAWDITTGSSQVVVGVMDSGIDGSHPDFENRILTSLCCDCKTDPYTLTGSPTDENGHGTHVAGIIGARGNNSLGVCGTCWNIKLVSLSVFNRTGHGEISSISRAIDYATANFIPILNFSGGWGDGVSESDTASVYYSISNYPGLFFCAAGNRSEDTDVDPFYPASFNLANIISVANVESSDSLYQTSNFGSSTIDLAAPGTMILSTESLDCCSTNANHMIRDHSTHYEYGYHYNTGTSMATAFVTGTAALIMSIRPDLNAEQIKALILDNVDKVSALNGKCVTGGRLNAYKAVRAATEPQTFTGDVNGDGYADLILSRKINGKRAFTVYKGKSNGKFESPVTTTSTRNFIYSDPAFVGDFNGDGRTDVLVHWSTSTNRQLLVYTGKADGTFNEGVNLSSTRFHDPLQFPHQFFVADVNGDGKDDFIVHYRHFTTGKRCTIVYQGKSSSPYINDAPTDAIQSTYDYRMDKQVFVGDFNGDGRSDMLVHGTYHVNNGPVRQRQLLVYTANSNGTYNEATVRTSSYIFSDESVHFSQYIVSSMTGSGKDTLTICYKGSNGQRYSVSYRGSDYTPYISDDSPQYLTAGTNVYNQTDPFFAGDFNGDGLDDLVLHQANSNNKRQLVMYPSVSTNVPGVGYGIGTTFTSTNTQNPSKYPSSFYVADVNNDGKDDFIVKWRTTGGNITIYTYLGNGTSFNSALSTTSSIPFYNE